VASVVRYPIDALRRLAPPAEARVGARVTAIEPGRALLVDPTGTLEARSSSSDMPALGAWVVAQGTWSGTVLESARFEIVSAPALPFPLRGG
jgi:hypothetical protein